MMRTVAGLTLLLRFAAIAEGQDSAAPPIQVERGAIVTESGVRLFYERRGEGLDTLVILHGGPGLSSAYMIPDLDFLARRHTLLFYDQRGTGRSTVVTDTARLRLADHLADLEAIRRHLGTTRLTLLGHSWGAGLAAHYARAYPDHVARLILVGAMPPRATPYMQQFGRSLRTWMDSTTAARFAGIAAARRGASDPVAACRAYWSIFIRGYFADPRDSSSALRMHGDVCNAPPDAIRNASVVSAAVMGPFGDWDWRDAFSQVRVPVLIIHGDKDPIPAVSAQEWQAMFQGSTLVLVKEAGHFAYVDQSAAVLRAVDAFLR